MNLLINLEEKVNGMLQVLSKDGIQTIQKLN
ncbi:hypothetical protein SDC9_197468 [bioreactor metagenome]|uniref:Uncharacterized protein n=1 Tax=bioreactor metagenome TaxID=1076179 RepID=A0A645IEY7_9ZZZZ